MIPESICAAKFRLFSLSGVDSFEILEKKKNTYVQTFRREEVLEKVKTAHRCFCHIIVSSMFTVFLKFRAKMDLYPFNEPPSLKATRFKKNCTYLRVSMIRILIRNRLRADTTTRDQQTNRRISNSW